MQVASSTQDQYLTLLVSQLQHQDPLEPVSQENFITQVAQFQSLESIEKLNTSFSTMLKLQTDLIRLEEVSLGSNLVGRDVKYLNSNNALAEGKVQGFAVDAEQLQLLVEKDGQQIRVGVGQVQSIAITA